RRRGGSLGRGELPRPPFWRSLPSEPAAAPHESAVGSGAAEGRRAPTAAKSTAADSATPQHVADDAPAQLAPGAVAAPVAGGVRALRGLDVGLGQRLGLCRQCCGVV